MMKILFLMNCKSKEVQPYGSTTNVRLSMCWSSQLGCFWHSVCSNKKKMVLSCRLSFRQGSKSAGCTDISFKTTMATSSHRNMAAWVLSYEPRPKATKITTTTSTEAQGALSVDLQLSGGIRRLDRWWRSSEVATKCHIITVTACILQKQNEKEVIIMKL